MALEGIITASYRCPVMPFEINIVGKGKVEAGEAFVLLSVID